MQIVIDYGVTENCKNPESYGVICVKCNQCGRFDKPNGTDRENDSEHKRDDA